MVPLAGKETRETKVTRNSNESEEKAVQVKTYHSFEELRTIQQQWDQFMESVGSEIFLTYDWCRIWWKYYGKDRDLRVFIFYYEDEIVGVIPLFFEKIWLGPAYVRVGKMVGSDFALSQFHMPIEAKYLRSVFQVFCRLLDGKNWDILHLGPIAGMYEDYDDLRQVSKELLGRSYLVFGKSKLVQTYFQLADDWKKQLTSLKKGERWDIKRSYKALFSEATPLVSTLASTDTFEQMFDNFVDMHQSYWEGLGKRGHFGDLPEAQEFHREVATVQLGRNRLRLIEIMSGKKCLGYEYDYKFGDRYIEFLNARSPSKEFAKISIGKVVFSEQVKKALDEGVRCIDSLRGEYAHKLRLGGVLFPIRSIYILPKKRFSLIRVFAFWTLAGLLNLCYYRIWFSRLAPKLPFKRRSLWQMWIRTNMFSYAHFPIFEWFSLAKVKLLVNKSILKKAHPIRQS